MAERIIDLRNKGEVSKKSSDLMPRAQEISIEWSSPEQERHDHDSRWFMVLGSVALVLALIGLYIHNYFFSVFVILAFAVLVAYERKTPSEVHVLISSEGVRVEKKVYKFSELKSFWLFPYSDIPELSLETQHTLSPFLRIPMRNVDPERVRVSLLNFLPEKEHQEFVSDKIARNL